MTVTGVISVLGVGVSVGALSRVLSRRARPSTGLAVAVGVVAALLGTVVARLVGVDVSGFSATRLLIQTAVAAGAVFVIAERAGSPAASEHQATGEWVHRDTTNAANGSNGRDARDGTRR